MTYYSWGDFDTFMMDVGSERIFRCWVYKKFFTPYEQAQKFMDESLFENITCDFVKIREVITLPDNSLLLGLQKIYDEEEENLNDGDWDVEYYKLDEIRLAYCKSDNEVE